MSESGSSIDRDSSFLDVNYVYDQISQALALFNQIFVDIAQNTGGTVIHRRDEIEIHHYNLSNPQNDAITQLYGFLNSVQEHTQAVRLKGIHQVSKLKSVPITFPDPSKNVASVNVLQKKIFCLQQFLVQELNRSEKSEAKVKKLENDLLQVTDELHKALKSNGRRQDSKISEASSTSTATLTQRQLELKVKTEAAAQNADPDPQENPQFYIGRYVRKHFDNGKKYFGLIIGFDEYFQVTIIFVSTFFSLFQSTPNFRLSIPTVTKKMKMLAT